MDVVLMMDSDEAGQRAQLKAFDIIVLEPFVRKWYADRAKKTVSGEDTSGKKANA